MRNHIEQMGIMSNIPSRNEPVPEIERHIRTVKERVHTTVNTLPSGKYPYILLVEAVYNTIFWLNCFPDNNSIHPTLSMHTIVSRLKINHKKTAHCNLVQTYKYMNHRTILLCQKGRLYGPPTHGQCARELLLPKSTFWQTNHQKQMHHTAHD